MNEHFAMRNEYPKRERCVATVASTGRRCRCSAYMKCPNCTGAVCGMHATYIRGRQVCQWCVRPAPAEGKEDK